MFGAQTRGFLPFLGYFGAQNSRFYEHFDVVLGPKLAACEAWVQFRPSKSYLCIVHHHRSCFTAIGTWWHIGNQRKGECIGMHWRSKKSDQQRQKKGYLGIIRENSENSGLPFWRPVLPQEWRAQGNSRAMMPKCSILCIFWTAICSCFF